MEEVEAFGAGKLRAAVMEGDVEWGSVMSGQCAGMIREIAPAAELVRRLFAEAAEVCGRLGVLGASLEAMEKEGSR